jgi:hypothetical protein
MNLDPHFPCISEGSAAPDSIADRLVVDELARTLHWRRDKYPARVSKGWMSAITAEDEIDMLAAIHADADCGLYLERWESGGHRDEDYRALQARQRATAEKIGRFGWSALVDCLRREIVSRRESYPKRVARNQMSEADARHQLERIEAAHARWWIRGRHFWPDALGPWRDGTFGTDPGWGADLFASWSTAYHLHRARFAPGPENCRGTYRAPPMAAPEEHQQEMAL